MRKNTMPQAERYAVQGRRRRVWHRIVGTLACVVVFVTTYALILPAITMEREPVCGLEEHTHTEECYASEAVAPAPEFLCSAESLTGHVHEEACYGADGALVCGYADFVVHTHDALCYDESGNLICPLPEIEEHIHTGDCYTEKRTLICTIEEDPGHTHTAACYKSTRGELICTEDHEHGDSCYEWTQELICGEEEREPGHVHDDSCYETEQVLVCGEEEVILHTHSDSCYDEAGSLICGWTEVLEHRHTEACMRTPESAPEEVRVLICPLEEHTHTQACFSETESGEPEPQKSGAEEPEEQACVDEVTALIDALPTSDEADAILTAFDDVKDYKGYGAYLMEVQPKIRAADEAYEALTDKEKAYVANAEKLLELDWLLDEQVVYDDPALEIDDAFVSELTATGAKVVSSTTDAPGEPVTVCNQDTITYSFFVRTESYSGTCYGEGRVKLEFVLPLTAEQAVFDLAAMPWLDQSAGYAPELITETRVIGDTSLPCQVLTGYKLLLPQEDNESAIPGEFTEAVSVTVLNMANGENIAVQISAAMEYGAWEGECETHLTEEKLTVATNALSVLNQLSAEEQQANYDHFLAEIEEIEVCGNLDDDTRAEAEDILLRLQEAYKQGELSEECYTELYERLCNLLYGDVNSIAEAAEGTNWVLLRDSGWFEEYSNYASSSASVPQAFSARSAPAAMAYADDGEPYAVPPSDVQVVGCGGTNTSDDGSVSVSKTISGTDLENVFDITLQVQTSVNVAEISEEPDMAVVIVMDISNTMNSNFGGVTRYAAAMTAAENFLDQFAENNSLGISKVGYVAFNTNAHQIFGLQPCSTAEQANALKNTMRTQTGSIINASGYKDSHSRFTNVEAGLAMAADMLNGVSNENKYIIFLSDGFPTTYISSGYSGYDPYDSTGRFYDHVLNKPCLYGTSYSDEAAIRARNKAAAIKASGVTIFSIGVDVAGQTIQAYITQSENASGYSVVDRTGTTYEIGDASSTEAYKNWLRNSIGSGYYYDSTDSNGLTSAYNQIFEEIKHQVEAGSVADWVAEDPLPTVGDSTETVEFIGFYNKTPELVFTNLTGQHTVNGENTAVFNNEKSTINWDLKESGYQETTNGGTTTYTYQLVYRVRLKNENSSFAEGTIYPTNDTTTLQYRTVEGTDGNLTISDPETIEFPIPSVQGYLSELSFKKTDINGQPLAGAEFTLHHDTDQCSICRGDGTSVEIQDMTATSNADGTVSFKNIPSGHKYILTETKVPDGYLSNGNTYAVEVAYDEITVTVTAPDGTPVDWTSTIENRMYYELPSTGGAGTTLYTVGGLLLIAGAVFLLLYNHTKRRKEDFTSS